MLVEGHCGGAHAWARGCSAHHVGLDGVQGRGRCGCKGACHHAHGKVLLRRARVMHEPQMSGLRNAAWVDVGCDEDCARSGNAWIAAAKQTCRRTSPIST